ncbi:tRNA (adenosine(37)-N6)-threonylcarbamoyltransferase complex ATPase subunit type 1 TsaE [Alishewanella sp. SMS9]|nr:tRNA (adenosine(37)-N6)-threonylcarbamoyltransferase complex ATPase subunit type 1 TsaE [Alishewanella sp. SMS9]
MVELKVQIDSEAQTAAFAAKLAAQLHGGLVLFLQGPLGAGKTTFSRCLIQSLGHTGKVKSPTYTLVEPYDLAGLQVYHFDLYRLHDAEELEFMGIRDYFNADSLCLIEWPERGFGCLPEPDLTLAFSLDATSRHLVITAHNALVQTLLTALTDNEKN